MNRAGTAELFRDDGGDTLPTSTLPVFSSKSAMFSVAENFLAALKGGKTVLCSPEEARDSLVVARDWAVGLCP